MNKNSFCTDIQSFLYAKCKCGISKFKKEGEKCSVCTKTKKVCTWTNTPIKNWTKVDKHDFLYDMTVFSLYTVLLFFFGCIIYIQLT